MKKTHCITTPLFGTIRQRILSALAAVTLLAGARAQATTTDFTYHVINHSTETLHLYVYESYLAPALLFNGWDWYPDLPGSYGVYAYDVNVSPEDYADIVVPCVNGRQITLYGYGDEYQVQSFGEDYTPTLDTRVYVVTQDKPEYEGSDYTHDTGDELDPCSRTVKLQFGEEGNPISLTTTGDYWNFLGAEKGGGSAVATSNLWDNAGIWTYINVGLDSISDSVGGATSTSFLNNGICDSGGGGDFQFYIYLPAGSYNLKFYTENYSTDYTIGSTTHTASSGNPVTFPVTVTTTPGDTVVVNLSSTTEPTCDELEIDF